MAILEHFGLRHWEIDQYEEWRVRAMVERIDAINREAEQQEAAAAKQEAELRNG